MKHLTPFVLLTALLLPSATAQTSTPAKTAPAAATTTAKATPEVTKPGAIPSGFKEWPALSKTPVRSFKAEPAFSLQKGKDLYALIDTNKGQLLIDLYEQETPVTVNNFVVLARNHFYDGLRFHRVIEGFMAQTGDPKSADEQKKKEWGTGDPGYKFADEIRKKLTFNSSGILAMANSGPGTNGSQFFITFAPTDFLTGKHTIFGKVTKGDDVLKKLTRTADAGDKAVEGAVADKILSVRILIKG